MTGTTAKARHPTWLSNGFSFFSSTTNFAQILSRPPRDTEAPASGSPQEEICEGLPSPWSRSALDRYADLPRKPPLQTEETSHGKKSAAKPRRKRGRPKKPWHLRVSYQRRRNPKRLRRWQVGELVEANEYATSIGFPLSTFVTIRWGKTAGGEGGLPARWTALLKSMKALANRQGFELAYVYVHENPQRSRGGLNSHFLANIPRRLRSLFEKRLNAILEAADGAVRVEPRCLPGRRDNRLQYMLKGTDKATAMKFGLIEPTKGWDYAQGIIDHKRAGTSTNIGNSARAKDVDNGAGMPHYSRKQR